MRLALKMIWKTQNDTRVCPICKALEGYTWIIEVGSPCPEQLFHPIYGHVYDTRPIAQGSLVKEHDSHVCRCTLAYELDISAAENNYRNPNIAVADNSKLLTEELAEGK